MVSQFLHCVKYFHKITFSHFLSRGGKFANFPPRLFFVFFYHSKKPFGNVTSDYTFFLGIPSRAMNQCLLIFIIISFSGNPWFLTWDGFSHTHVCDMTSERRLSEIYLSGYLLNADKISSNVGSASIAPRACVVSAPQAFAKRNTSSKFSLVHASFKRPSSFVKTPE